MSRAYKRHYLEVLWACTKHVAERLYGERPASVLGTSFNWTLWYTNRVRMRDGSLREVRFPLAVFEAFQNSLNLGLEEEAKEEEAKDAESPADAIRRAYAGLVFPGKDD